MAQQFSQQTLQAGEDFLFGGDTLHAFSLCVGRLAPKIPPPLGRGEGGEDDDLRPVEWGKALTVLQEPMLFMYNRPGPAASVICVTKLKINFNWKFPSTARRGAFSP
jgi:hypothetical protein